MWWDILEDTLPKNQIHVEVALEYVPISLGFIWKNLKDRLLDLDCLDFEVLVNYLVTEDIPVSEESKAKQFFQSDKLGHIFDSPTEQLLKYLISHQVDLSEMSKKKLTTYFDKLIDGANGGDYVKFRRMAPLLIELGLRGQPVQEILQVCYEDELQLNVLIENDVYIALMESIDHDHTNVVGYRSCTAECYCD
jgi:hypothetical protein